MRTHDEVEIVFVQEIRDDVGAKNLRGSILHHYIVQIGIKKGNKQMNDFVRSCSSRELISSTRSAGTSPVGLWHPDQPSN